MSLVVYKDRKNTDCDKWDNLAENFGDTNLLPMWVADMDFQVPSCVTDAIIEYAKEGVFGYYKVPDSYYESFINWERTYHGYETKKEWLRFSPGVVSGFNWMLQILTEKSDSVIILTPVYYPFTNAIEHNERKLVTCDLVNTNGIYSIDFEDFEKKIVENDVKAMIFCSPHNPVGRVWKREELKTLFDICRKHHVFIISDEIHHDLLYDGNTHIPSATVGDYDDMLVTITAPSKTFNLAGCQNSIVIIPDEGIRARWDKFVECIRIHGGNTFGYLAARAAYTDGRPWLEEVLSLIYSNYLYLKDTFAKELPNIIVSPLEGTYLAWVDLGAYVPAKELESFIQKKCKLAFDYGNWFGGDANTHVRVNLATSRENVETAVNAIIQNLK